MNVEQEGASRTLNLDNSILKLCLKLFGTLNPTGNLCFSPAGLHQVLSVLVTFSEETGIKRRLFELLDLPENYDPSHLYNAWARYLTNLKPHTLKVRLALFSRQRIGELKLDPELEIFKHKYRGDIIPFEDSFEGLYLLSERIDEWIELVTTGMIRKIDMNLDCVHTLLVSSLSFNEFNNQQWEIRKDGHFFIDNFTYVQTDFMCTIAHLEYTENSDFEAIKLEYKNPVYYLLILLPKKVCGTNELERIVTSSTDYLSNLKFTREKVFVKIPRFFIQQEMDVLGTLRGIFPDLEDLFIFRAHNMHVTTIKQVNRIDVRKQKRVPFSWDDRDKQVFKCGTRHFFFAARPMIYMLCHGEKILIAGRLCNPTEH